MKRLLLLTVSILCVAGLAYGQAGQLGLFADQAGTNCWLSPIATGVSAFYVVHVNTGGATAVEFSIPQPACYTATYLSWAANFPVASGNPVVGAAGPPVVLPGASVAYGACMVGPILVGTVSYFGNTADPCCEYPVLPHQITGLMSYTDCGLPFPAKLPLTGVPAYFFGNATCPCATPTHNSTWGGVKSLYSTEN